MGEFTIYDKGVLGRRTEGNVIVPSHVFFPNGCEATFPISGHVNAKLYFRIYPAMLQESDIAPHAGHESMCFDPSGNVLRDSIRKDMLDKSHEVEAQQAAHVHDGEILFGML